MFELCSSFETLQLTMFDTLSVNNVNRMFKGCARLTDLNLSSFKTRNVTNMSALFQDCYALPAVDVTGFLTYSATDMRNMFYNCYALTDVDVTRFQVDKVDYMEYMFAECRSMQVLDLSTWTLKSNVRTANMFLNDYSLTTVFVGEAWNNASIHASYDDNMFLGCTSIKGAGGVGYHTTGTAGTVAGAAFTFNNDRECATIGKYLSAKYLSGTVYWSLDGFGELLFTPIEGTHGNLAPFGRDATGPTGAAITTDIPWRDCVENIRSVKIADSATAIGVSDLESAAGKKNGGSINYMFRNCVNLTTCDLTKFDTGNATSMYGMFENCTSLVSVNISKFSTTNVATFARMFAGSTKLETLNIANFAGPRLESMESMFEGCTKLSTIKFPTAFNTSSTKNMKTVFKNCTSLMSLDLSGFKTEGATHMNGMFENCTALTSVDLRSFDVASALEFSNMFKGCSKLVSANLSTFSATSLQKTDGMFQDCRSLTTVHMPADKAFNGPTLVNIRYMFKNCTSLASIDLNAMDVAGVTGGNGTYYMSEVFDGCTDITSIDISSWNLAASQVQTYRMFYNCRNLVSVYVGSGWKKGSLNGTYSGEMFTGCVNIIGADGSTYRDGAYTYAEVGNNGYLSAK